MGESAGSVSVPGSQIYNLNVGGIEGLGGLNQTVSGFQGFDKSAGGCIES